MESFTDFHDVQPVITKRLNEFKNVTRDEDIFYELCYCLLTPQSKGTRCAEAVRLLKQKKFYTRAFNTIPILKTRTRFHNTKARYLREARHHFKHILAIVRSSLPAHEKREWLVNTINGMGYKEAGHFLRNTGHRNLAILDRHILKNLYEHKIIPEHPRTLTQNKYLFIEKAFLTYSKTLGIPVDELDLYFWYKETGEVFK